MALLFLFLAIFYLQTKKTNIKAVKINNWEITVETAKTPFSQAQGLSGREKLAENQGLLFVFQDYKVRNFWMQGMNFPIDVLWIKDNVVVGLEKNIPLTEEGRIKRFNSPLPVNYVLEINAGAIDKNKIKINDKIEFIYEK